MTVALLLLSLCFLVLALLLLSLNLRSVWSWRVKAAAIAVTGLAAVGFFVAATWMLGWPTEATPPARFTLHGGLVHEPGKTGRRPEPGAIFLWLSRVEEIDRRPAPPRAFALPYSRELHEQVARATARLEQGRPVEGRTRKRTGLLRREVPVIELFEAPLAELPPKTAG